MPIPPHPPRSVRRRAGAVLLAVAGVANAVPALGALSAERLRTSYGLPAGGQPDATADVLLQHRGVLFLVTGGLLVVAAVRPHLRPAAVLANATSCAAFVVLATTGGPVSGRLGTVARLDVGILALLAAGWALSRSTPTRGSDAAGAAP